MSELSILLSGASGRLGRAVRDAAGGFSDVRIAAGIDPSRSEDDIPVFADASEVPDSLQVGAVIDCSHHTAVKKLLELSLRRGLPTVICTTGHTEEEAALIRAAAEKIPVFWSGNMSLGVNLLVSLAKKAAQVLGKGWDVEIIEKHHSKKLDAPSGTALMIANALSEAVAESSGGEAEYVYERQSRHAERRPNEIGIHSVRGGTIVGEHEVIFAGKDEVLTLTHSAASRGIFAEGALRAAKWLSGQPAGLYDMSDMIG